jgi:formylmethanofuran dehydrogenase subunit E
MTLKQLFCRHEYEIRYVRIPYSLELRKRVAVICHKCGKEVNVR